MWIRHDKEDGTTEVVSEFRVKQLLTGFYHNVSLAVRVAKESHIPVETSFARYTWEVKKP